MAKASIKLPDGTDIEISGTADEISRIIALYSSQAPTSAPKARKKRISPSRRKARDTSKGGQVDEVQVDHANIVHLVKTCDEAEAIGKNILDKRKITERVLLPLYIVHEHLKNSFGLTSGDISKITKELSVPVSQSNTSSRLSGAASRYISGDKVRKPGVPVRYKLIRPGVRYLKGVIKGTDGDKQK